MSVFRGDACRLPFPNKTFDMSIGSPPYIDARDYLEDGVDLGISRKCQKWVEWMLLITAECLRVTKGPVIWIVAGVTRKRNYQPGPEGLLWEWWKRGGECHCLRPLYWYHNGMPGSGGDQWFRNDVEYCLAFKRPGKLPYAKPLANGHFPRWAPGGDMSYRMTSGARVDQCYNPPVLANPGNLLHVSSGGGQMGNILAHDNEAPFPVDVPKFFVASFVPEGGRVLDPFLGSGTTIQAALELGVEGYGCDLRQSQCVLSRRRLRNVTKCFHFQGDRDGRDPELNVDTGSD